MKISPRLMLPPALSAVLAIAAAAPAASLSIGRTSTGYPFTATLTSITIDRGSGDITYPTSQLTNIQLTSYAAEAVGSSIVMVGDGNPVPSTGSRAALLEDWRLDTGVLNPAISNSQAMMTADFLAPVANGPGADIVLFELAASGNPDPVYVHLNGTIIRYLPGDYTTNLTGNLSIKVGTSNSATNSLAALESNTYTLGNVINNQNIAGLAIDLSDFGVAPGASVSSIGLSSSGTSSSTVDPVLIAGLPVPEPASLAVITISSVCILQRRCAAR